MSEIDLDIKNYNLRELLDLFHLPYNFTKQDLKQAIKIVYKMHPDKSGLDKEYFMFFRKAYGMIRQVYEFRANKTKSVVYESTINSTEKQKEEKQIIENITTMHSSEDKQQFHTWFNKMFDNVKISDDADDGYGNWFKSSSNGNENDHNDERLSQHERENKIMQKKQQLKNEIVVHQDIEEMNSGSNQYSLTRERQDYYGSDIFSKLRYDDLKKAHTETVVPVTEQDFHNKEKFNSLDEYRQHRTQQSSVPISDQQAKEYLRDRQNMEQRQNQERAFRILKQDEEIGNAQQKWWGQLKQLKN